MPKVAKPTANRSSGEIDGGTAITFSTSTGSAIIYYTMTVEGYTFDQMTYSSPIVIASDMDIRVIAKKAGYFDSDELDLWFTIKANPI